MEQKQEQGDRRQSQTQYQGEDRRKHDSIFDEPTIIPPSGNDPMDIQERKDDQAERARQQREQGDRH